MARYRSCPAVSHICATNNYNHRDQISRKRDAMTEEVRRSEGDQPFTGLPST
jgi:hypothetical protein